MVDVFHILFELEGTAYVSPSSICELELEIFFVLMLSCNHCFHLKDNVSCSILLYMFGSILYCHRVIVQAHVNVKLSQLFNRNLRNLL